MVAGERNAAPHAGGSGCRPGFSPQCFQHQDGFGTVHHLAGEERVAIAHGVVEAIRDRIAAELARDQVDVLFPGGECLLIARRANVGGRQRIRVDATQLDAHVRYAIRNGTVGAARQERCHRLGRGIGAAIV
jgi:hypothetical protein